jgi:hypothetical protein
METTTAGRQEQEPRRPPPAEDAALLTELAGMLGLGDKTARQFADSGRLQLDDIEFALHANGQSGPARALIAAATMPCPPHVDPSTWHDALLVANEAAMIAGEWGFAIDEDNAASLLMRVGESMQTAGSLRAVLEGMYELCSAVRTGASALGESRRVAQ